jgi:hypothetical protein
MSQHTDMSDQDAQLQRVGRLLETAAAAEESGDLARARSALEDVTQLVPMLFQIHFNLGILHLAERRWAGGNLAFRHAERAILQEEAEDVGEGEGEDPERAAQLSADLSDTRRQIALCEAAMGNLGAAQELWATLPDTAVGDHGYVAVRLSAHPFGPPLEPVDEAAHRLRDAQEGVAQGSGGGNNNAPLREFQEIVWATRLDPARVLVENVPTPESRHRYHDIVLVDQKAAGWRELSSSRVPVFNMLETLSRSKFSTFEIQCECDDGALKWLIDACGRANLPAEAWTGLRAVCRQCADSAGCSHGGFGAGGDAAATPRKVGVAAHSLAEVQAVAQDWADDKEDRTLLSCTRVLQ